MKILQVCAYAAQYGGNFIASLLALENSLVKKGHQISYLFPKSASQYEWCKKIEDTHQVFYCDTNRFSYKTFLEVKNAVKDMDLIHSHFELYDMLVVLAAKKNQRVIWHLHDSFDEKLDWIHKTINKIQYAWIGKNTTLVSPSAYYADYVIGLGYNKKNTRVIANCIDLKRLEEPETVETRYDFLVFGGFYYIKGLDILLDACRILKNKKKKFCVGVVGYKDTWNWIENQYPDINDCFVRLNPTEQVSLLYESVKVFMSTSRRECFSYALLEALASGRPAIVSDIPGNQWCKTYKTAYTFENENAEDLAKRMSSFIDSDFDVDKEALAITSEAIKSIYNVEKWASEIEEVYFESGY